MNLQKLHDAIIEKAKTRGTVEGYKETHHILPRSMGGGDEVDNLIELTAKEHFVIHHLLAKIHGGPMAQAFGMMCLAKNAKTNKRDYIVSSRVYEQARVLISEQRKGKPMKEETRRKISESSKGVLKSEETKAKMRKPKTKEHALNISKARMGSKNPMFGKPSPTKGIPHSEEMRKLIAQRTKEATMADPCPHCGKITNKGNALRWHFDNCKMRNM